MNNTPFIFKKSKNEKTTPEDLEEWKEIERKLWEEFKKYRVKLHDPYNPEAFEVVIREPQPERSPKALNGYWRLIGVITNHINQQNQQNWDVEDVSDTFKRNIGFTRKVYIKELGGECEIKTRSLARNQGCTIDDMNKLIGEILAFGAEIPDCVLSSEEERQFNKYYGAV